MPPFSSLLSVHGGASDKITDLKARVVSAGAGSKASVPAKPLPAKPCAAAPTQALPVKLVGVADQMPGDREANEALIARVDGDIQVNKAKSIREKVLKDSYQAAADALNAHDDFHQFQAKVLREPTLPPPPRE